MRNPEGDKWGTMLLHFRAITTGLRTRTVQRLIGVIDCFDKSGQFILGYMSKYVQSKADVAVSLFNSQYFRLLNIFPAVFSHPRVNYLTPASPEKNNPSRKIS